MGEVNPPPMKGWPPATATACGPEQTKPPGEGGLGGSGLREFGAVPGGHASAGAPPPAAADSG